jgi:arsenate reductase
MRLYGIATCDQVRRARKWLEAQGVKIDFIDLKTQPITSEKLREWLNRVPYDSLMNKRSLAWRALSIEQRRSVVDQASAIELMVSLPMLIKRPVLEMEDRLIVGFSEPLYEGLSLALSPV